MRYCVSHILRQLFIAVAHVEARLSQPSRQEGLSGARQTEEHEQSPLFGRHD
jgi:hypothetical protein